MMRLSSVLVLLVGASFGPMHLLGQTRDVPLAFTNVTVVDVRTGTALADMTVVVSDDRITAVGTLEEIEVPAGTQVIEGAGKYLIPGLWDMHAHTTTDRNTREIIFPLLIAHGITGIRSMAADCFETGEPNCEEEGSSATLASIHDVRRWRQEIAIGTLAGPRVVAGSYYVNSPGPGEASTSQYPGTAEHGREHARLLNERGVDFIKVYSGLSREAFFALADEANRLGLAFAGETPVTVRASEASVAGQRSIEHLGFGNIMEECSSMEDELRPRLIAEFENAAIGSRHDSEGPAILSLMLEMVDTHDPEKCAALAEQFVRNETWVVPTLMIMRLPSELGRGWREDPYARFLSPDERRYFEWAEEAYARDLGDEAARAPHSRWAREMTRTMRRAGVRMLAGSDAGETGVFWGIGLHQELELLVSAGLTQAEALRAATLGPAEFLGATDSLGTVEAGKMADLVLLDANPLEDITNTQRIAAVVATGRLIDRDALDAMLADAERAARSSSSRTEPDTVRYTLVPSGIPSGERLVWTDPPDVWHSRLDLRGSVLDTRVELDSVGLPVRTEITGMQPGREPLAWDEHFELTGDMANWSTPAEQGSDMVRGPGFYVPSRYTPPFTLHLLARALLQRPDHTLPILPKGEARLEALERRTIEVAGRSRTVRLHAVHGLDFAPEYIWLDEDGSLFADDVSILAGWDAAFPELDAAATDALAEHAWRVFGEWIPPARERPLVIHGARLFDPASRSVRDGMTVLVQEDRIHSVGADGSIEVPEGADVIDATGRTMLPGLWDMHVHLNDDFVEEMEVPLFVAAGVTTVRDLGSDTDFMSSIRRRAEAGRAIAPRILPALILYGPGAWPLGAGVGTMEEARAAVDRFAALGYVQVKFYNPVPPELAPVIIERARSHRMRVSGHIPNGLTSRQAMESGFDEIQHLFYARIGAAQLRGLTPDDDLGARMAAVRVGTDEWEEFVELLRIHEIVIDPTLAVVEESVGGRPPVWLGEVLHRFPAQAGRVALHGVGPDAPPAPLRERWDDIVANGPELVRALYEAGVPLVAGTDGPIGGFALHRELELYVEAGIPAPEVLHIATLGAARVMGMDDELGSIEPGKLADLILVDGDPTADISDIRRVVTVIKNGGVHDPAAIYRALGIADALVFSDTVHVAPPTGEETTDRASILAALERVLPGGTVLFAPGTYLVGELIPIATPRITMQGHPQGTTLRACEPDEYHRMELAVTDATGEDEAWAAVTRCGMFMLTGGYTAIRGFTFEYTRLGLLLGCCHRGGEMRPDDGGYRIEENTFRNLGNGIRAMLDAPVPSVIRGNRFINVFHALSAPQASHLQFIDNELSVPEPHLVPAAGYPSFAVAINALTDGGICEHNLVSGNRIEGHPIAIRVGTRPGSICLNNVIRDNTITASRVPLPAVRIHDDEPLVTNPADSTFFGVPVQLVNGSGEAGQGVLEENVIEGNRLIGAQGLAILLSHASGNRVANNTIGGVAILDPFPGNVLGRLPEWSEANGSAIWVSPGSEDNEITGNIFDSVAGHAVVLEGDRNRVELRSTSDGVRDLGSGNLVSRGNPGSPAAAPGGDAGVVHVAPPTGNRRTDRASILAALGDVEPGGTVQFAPGTYLMGGRIIRITVPRVTLAGHPAGTTLRGCHPDEFPMQDNEEFGNYCNGLELAGGWQAVRNLTIEHAFWALHVGCCWDSRSQMRAGEGGHLIEGNTLRSNRSAVRVHGYWSEPTVVRNNRLLNNWHSVAVYGNTVHLLDNDISAPEPEEVQWSGFPADGILVARPPNLHESAEGVKRTCDNNVVSGNRIDGVTEGIMIIADDPQIICRNNIIRDNTIIIRRARPPVIPDFIHIHDEADSTVVGVPLALRGPIEDNLIEGNVIQGAEGLGIELRGASRNRIVNNTINGVARREPFPGNAIAALPVLGGDPEAWRDANGSGIWVSPGSDGNEIVGNTFEEIAGAAIFLEGDRNRIILSEESDAFRDLGTGNRVVRGGDITEGAASLDQPSQAATAEDWTDPSPHEVRYVTVAPGVELEVLDWGGGGTPLVFLAGANFNAHSFDDFAPRFTDTHRVLGITRRGHGASSWPDSGYDLPTLVEDIRLVLDSFGIDRTILAGHSMAGSEMTLLATEYPDRVAALIYIDAGHDPTDIERLRVPELCSFSGLAEAMERTFENPELVRRTQWHTDEDGVRRPFASAAAGAGMDLPTPDYSGVVVPALGIYYVPERTEDLFMGVVDPPAACVAAFHRYIHGGIAAFVDGVEQATVIALSDTNHNIHLVSPDELEEVMRRWLAELPEER